MKINVYILITAIYTVYSYFINENNHIRDLTNDITLSDNDTAVILFYYPWDVSYQTFLPEYIKTSYYFNSRNNKNYAQFYKVDCSINSPIAESFEVNSFPSIILVKKRIEQTFSQNFLSEELIHFIITAIEAPVLVFNSVKDINSFLPLNSYLLIDLLPNSSPNIKENIIFVDFAGSFTAIPIYYIKCNSNDCLKEYAYNKLVFIRNLDNDIGINYYNSSISITSMQNLILKYLMKPCAPITSIALDIMFSSLNRSFLLYFRDEYNASHTYKDYFIQNITKENIQRLSSYSISLIGNPLHKSIANYLGISTNTLLPQIMLISINTSEVLYYSMKVNSIDEISFESLKTFYMEYNQGVLTPLLRSEPIPDENKSNALIKVVGLTYRYLIDKRTNGILVLFYETKCDICINLLIIWEELANRYQVIDMAHIDIKQNSVKGLSITAPPMIYYFSSNIAAAPIIYKGEFNYDSIETWIRDVLKKEAKAKLRKIKGGTN